MVGKDEISYMGVTGCYSASKDTLPEFFRKDNIMKETEMDCLPTEYPSELLVGDHDKEHNPLVKYFKNKKWKYSWDFDKISKVYWYEIYSGDKIVLQIEFDETVEAMIKAIKKLIPVLKNVEDFDKKVPDIMKEYLDKIEPNTCIYIGGWDGK